MDKNLYITTDLYDAIEEITQAYLTEDGKEVNNPKPMFIDTGLENPPTLKEQIQRLVKINLSEQMHSQGQETFEESQDFDIGDSFDQGVDDTKYTIMDEEHYIPSQEMPLEAEPPGEGPEGIQKVQDNPTPDDDPNPTVSTS